MCSLAAGSSRLYYQVRIVKAHVYDGVIIPPNKIHVGGTVGQYHYRAERVYLPTRNRVLLLPHRVNAIPPTKDIALEHVRSMLCTSAIAPNL